MKRMYARRNVTLMERFITSPVLGGAKRMRNGVIRNARLKHRLSTAAKMGLAGYRNHATRRTVLRGLEDAASVPFIMLGQRMAMTANWTSSLYVASRPRCWKNSNARFARNMILTSSSAQNVVQFDLRMLQKHAERYRITAGSVNSELEWRERWLQNGVFSPRPEGRVIIDSIDALKIRVLGTNYFRWK